MKATRRALAIALVLAPAASFATKIPIPVEGATLNVSVQFQPQFLVTEAGTPDGTSAAYDVFVRRTRLLINGDVGPNFSYLLQIDNANFGKWGNFTGRAIVQDAWVGWAPTGITGPMVLYIDAGILLIPISHHMLQSTTNFITADAQTDGFRFPGIAVPAFRNTGVQLRGWALNKKIGFRGGVYEGYAPAAATLGAAPANTNTAAATNCNPATAGSCITPKRNPMLSGFVNFDVIGSEEGGWLYGAYKWGKDPILSVGLSGNYQSLATRNLFASLADVQVYSADVYLNFPMTEAAELVAEGTAYLNSNGTGGSNTGLGLSGSIGYRFGSIAPYVAYDYFSAKDCDTTLSNAQLATCNNVATAGRAHNADSRNFKAGINFFFNKNLNHVNLEFGVNHGTSAYGPQSINGGNAAYVPLALDPLTPTGARRPLSSVISLAQPSFKSLLLHWNFLF